MDLTGHDYQIATNFEPQTFIMTDNIVVVEENLEPRVVYATVREAEIFVRNSTGWGGDVENEWHIECRFSDGQKLAAIKVAYEFEHLADKIASFLNKEAGVI